MKKLREELKENLFTIESAIDAFIEQNNRMTKPLKTDFEYLKWLDEGRMIVLGGGSGLGKTAYVLQMIYDLVKDNQGKDENDQVIGIYASSEMTVEELTMRLIVNQQAISGISMDTVRHSFNSRLKTPEEIEEYRSQAKFVLGSVPFYFLNASRFNLQSIIAMIRATREKNPHKRIFVVIDYLQLMLLGCNTLEEKNRAIFDLKTALTEYKANAIAISALNRDSLRNNYVDMSAFKDSGMIEYTTDIGILFSFKDEKGKYTLKSSEEVKQNDSIEMYAKCVKNRLGIEFANKMTFNKKRQKFEIERDFEVVIEDADEKPASRDKVFINEALDITIETRDPTKKEAKKKINELKDGGLDFG